MRLPERGQNARDDLVGADPGRVDRDVRPPVVALSRPIELFDVGHRAPLEHGAIADPAGALVQLAHVAVEPYDRPELAQPLHPAFTARQTTAGRDDFARLQLEALERIGLELTESRLARVAKDLGDRAALGGDDHVVGLDEAATETASEQPPADRFSGTHEPTDNDIIRLNPCFVSVLHLSCDVVRYR